MAKEGELMDEVIKLIEYSNLAGFPLTSNGEKLKIKNGRNLPHNLKKLLIAYKDDILTVLEGDLIL